MARLQLGIALGSGSARGWAHIGVLRGLYAAGVRPDIVCGSSIGALVGAAYASGRLPELEAWVRGLDWWELLRYVDVGNGGLFDGDRLLRAFAERVEDRPIEDLPVRLGVVATDLTSGREVWVQSGPLLQAVRASIALPGMFSPVRQDGRWLVDGGLVDPVPVSLCRAMGADRVIAVNLNGDIVGRHILRRTRRPRVAELLDQLGDRVREALGTEAGAAVSGDAPGVFETMAGAMNIMQDRITRSRMAGDPPDVLLAPRLAHLALMDYDRAPEAISAGEDCVARHQGQIADLLAELEG